jgi:hypothetical protein
MDTFRINSRAFQQLTNNQQPKTKALRVKAKTAKLAPNSPTIKEIKHTLFNPQISQICAD